MANHTLSLPIGLLREHERDTLMLLRLGAGANAMEGAQRLLLNLRDQDDRPVTMVARVQTVFAAIGYWREVVKMIDKEKWADRLWELVQRAVDDGMRLGCSIDEARHLLSPANPDVGGDKLLKVRDKIGFHWDPQPFKAYLEDPDTKTITLWESDGDRNANRVFRGASDAMSHYFFGVPGADSSLQTLLPLVAQAQGVLGPVVEAATYGMLIESGLNPKDYWLSGDEA